MENNKFKEINENNTFVIEFNVNENVYESGLKQSPLSQTTPVLLDSIKRNLVSGAMCTVILLGANTGQTAAVNSTYIPNSSAIFQTNTSVMVGTNRGNNYRTPVSFSYTSATEVLTNIQNESYTGTSVDGSTLEEMDMDNQYFDVMSNYLYKLGFTVFGTSSLVFAFLWGTGAIANEIGLIGLFMSLGATSALFGMRFLFGRFFKWI